MTGTKSWQAQIDITETDSEVTAEARLSGTNGAPLVGNGTALCNPADENVPAIGDELAVARALSHLSHQLLNAAADDIEAHTHKPVEGGGARAPRAPRPRRGPAGPPPRSSAAGTSQSSDISVILILELPCLAIRTVARHPGGSRHRHRGTRNKRTPRGAMKPL
ncbi:DUF1876 domain-containing protein [Streptomyces celluloflavus]